MAGRDSERAKVAADLPAKNPRAVPGSSTEPHPDHAENAPADAMPFGIGESDRTARIARSILAERRRRASFFDPTIFGEPAWDILLALYGDERTHGRQTIGQLVNLRSFWLDAAAMPQGEERAALLARFKYLKTPTV